MAISTVILIILGILVLLIILFLINNQTGIFSNVINSFQSKSNVDLVVQGCNALVQNQQEYSYCCEKKDVVVGKIKEQLTCNELRQKNYTFGKIETLNCEGQCKE